jgi:hypothetical protein
MIFYLILGVHNRAKMISKEYERPIASLEDFVHRSDRKTT